MKLFPAGLVIGRIVFCSVIVSKVQVITRRQFKYIDCLPRPTSDCDPAVENALKKFMHEL